MLSLLPIVAAYALHARKKSEEARRLAEEAVRNPPPYAAAGPVTVSVVIPTHDEERYIGDCLSSLGHQTLRPLEVVVVDWASTDRTVAVASAHGAKVVAADGPGIAKARNLGARHASGDVLLFTDGDCVFEHRFLEKVARHFSDPGVVMVHGGEKADRGASIVDDFLWEAYRDLKPIWVSTGRCIAIRRPAFWEIGGFDESLASGEDVDLGWRAMERWGYQAIRYDKSLVVVTSLRRVRRYGYPLTMLGYVTEWREKGLPPVR